MVVKYPDPETRLLDDHEVWEAVVPRKKGRIYGFGVAQDPEFVMTGTPSTPSIGHSYAGSSSTEVLELQEQLRVEWEAREAQVREEQEEREALEAQARTEREAREALEAQAMEQQRRATSLEATVAMLIRQMASDFPSSSRNSGDDDDLPLPLPLFFRDLITLVRNVYK